MLRSIPFLALLLLVACESSSAPVRAEDSHDLSEGYAEAKLVDLAVLPPSVPASPALPDRISEVLRGQARRFLIERKLYAVPADAFVDQRLAGLEEVRASDLDSDGLVVIEMDQFEVSELLTQGRITVGGMVRVMSEHDTVFTRTFRNKRYLSPRRVTPVNHNEALRETTDLFIRDILSPIPPKALE